MERIRVEFISERDAPHTDSVRVFISALQPSKGLSERVTGGKSTLAFVSTFALALELYRLKDEILKLRVGGTYCI